jgi:hypothetical protein
LKIFALPAHESLGDSSVPRVLMEEHGQECKKKTQHPKGVTVFFGDLSIPR